MGQDIALHVGHRYRQDMFLLQGGLHEAGEFLPVAGEHGVPAGCRQLRGDGLAAVAQGVLQVLDAGVGEMQGQQQHRHGERCQGQKQYPLLETPIFHRMVMAVSA
ncbi:MAG: hypothetical protein A2Z44_10450 [Betaproteobacteria bacterium RBG_19FT_COMBO_58_11]|nr:MAG: hypothetical protein A2Z44_10450 [Betaproteobacteria bacterium RBG_19FT_COMBO_58_11]